MRFRCLVNDIDVSTHLIEPPDDEWSIEDKAYGEVGNATFMLDDPGSTLAFSLLTQVQFQEFSDTANIKFGGLLTEITDIIPAGLGRRYACKALSWVYDLEKTSVNEVYRGISDGELISSTSNSPKGIFFVTERDFSSYTIGPDISTGNSNVNKMVFNGDTIRSIMDTLADWQGFIWGVQPDRTVYYRDLTAQTSTFSLSDAPVADSSSYYYYNYTRHQDGVKAANQVTVIGGRFLNRDQDSTFGAADGADGKNTLFTTKYQWGSREGAQNNLLEVYANIAATSGEAANWDIQNVGVPRESGDVTKGVIWDELARTLEFSTAPPAFDAAYRLVGDLLRPVIGVESDQDSIDDIGLFDISIKDVTLTDDDAVDRRAKIELNKRIRATEKLEVTTNQDGAKAGDTMRIVNSRYGIDASYLIETVLTRPLSSTHTEYELSLRKILT